MARKTKYSEYYKQYQRKVSALRKQGIELRYPEVYQTEKTLRRWGIKGKELSKITRDLKKQLKTFSKHEAIDISTGEILTVGELKKSKASERAKRGAKTRKANKEAERAFWSVETELHLNTPQMGDIVTSNVYEELISKIQSPVDTDTVFGSKRKSENIRMSENAQNYLQMLFSKALKEYGSQTLGERLEKYADIIEQDIDYILNASKGVELSSALHRVAVVIKGGNLDEYEKERINQEQELGTSWDVNDYYYE